LPIEWFAAAYLADARDVLREIPRPAKQSAGIRDDAKTWGWRAEFFYCLRSYEFATLKMARRRRLSD
jgi:hypothetical protein